MTKGLRTTVYAAAALTLAALLVLLLMPAQARYLRTAQWQASYAASPPELTSDLLALRDDKAQLLLADWSPTAEETKSVKFNMTCPAELLQMPTVEETAETQPAEPVSVTLGAVDDTHLQAKTQVNCSTSSETGAAKITVTLTLTVQAVPESAVDVKLPIHVTITGAEGIWFGGILRFTLCPATEGGSSAAEESVLFNDAASMTEYDVTQSFYVQYTLPPDCTAAEMKLDNAGFPRGTRFSTDNGGSYSVLCEDRPIPVTGSQSLLVDMSRATTENGDRTLRLTANDQVGKVFTDTLALTAKSWSGHAAATYTEDGLPSMQIQPWNSGRLQVTAAVEQLARVKEPVLTEKQENTAQKQPQTTVKYVSADGADGVVRIEWTTAGEGEDAATEGSSPANAAEAQTLTLLPAKGIVPAGTYRVTICWKCNNVLIAERVIPFFVTR